MVRADTYSDTSAVENTEADATLDDCADSSEPTAVVKPEYMPEYELTSEQTEAYLANNPDVKQWAEESVANGTWESTEDAINYHYSTYGAYEDRELEGEATQTGKQYQSTTDDSVTGKYETYQIVGEDPTCTDCVAEPEVEIGYEDLTLDDNSTNTNKKTNC